MKLTPHAIEHLLECWPVARLGTLGEDGRPHQVPVVFVRCGETIWTPIDGKHKASGLLARTRNVRRDPKVSLLMDHYEEDWKRLWWLRVDGSAEVHNPADPEGDPQISPVLAALRHKYPQYRDVSLLAGRPTLICVRMLHVQSWCAAPEASPTLREAECSPAEES